MGGTNGDIRHAHRSRRWLARVAPLVLALAVALNGCASSASVGQATRTPTSTATATTKPTQVPWSEPVTQFNRNEPLTLDQVAQRYLSHMTLNQELGQLMLVALDGTTYNANNAGMIEQQGAGGILLYTANMTSKAQTRALIATAQAHADFPLLVMTDEEGGYVDRLTQFYGWRPSATDIGQKGSTSFAQAQGVQTGKDMSTLGFNGDFAPDVDVQLVAGPDQVTRTFGSTPEAVTSMAGAYLTGMQSEGVAVCLKHFPGLGAATKDAHLGLPVINRTLDQIESVELAPYRALLATGQVDMVMSTDLLMPALDPTLPAELSPAIINGVLRTELGFNGVVITDALYMQGISDKYSETEAAALAIEAGDDMLVGAFTPTEVTWMEDGIRNALATHQITKARIDQSVLRILTLKLRMGMLPVPANEFDMTTAQPIGSMMVHLVSGPIAWVPKH